MSGVDEIFEDKAWRDRVAGKRAECERQRAECIRMLSSVGFGESMVDRLVKQIRTIAKWCKRRGRPYVIAKLCFTDRAAYITRTPRGRRVIAHVTVYANNDNMSAYDTLHTMLAGVDPRDDGGE